MLFTRWSPDRGTEKTSHVQGISSDRLGIVGDHPSIGVVELMELVQRTAHELAALVGRQRLGELVRRLVSYEAEVARGAVGYGGGHHSGMQNIGMKFWLGSITETENRRRSSSPTILVGTRAVLGGERADGVHLAVLLTPVAARGCRPGVTGAEGGEGASRAKGGASQSTFSLRA